MFQSFFSLCLFLSQAVSFADAYGIKPETRPSGKWSPVVPRQTFNLDIDRVFEKQKENREIDPFLHTKELFRAIHAGSKSFEIFENVHDAAEKNRFSYEDITTAKSYNATAKYHLFKNAKYFSLDNAKIAHAVVDVSENSMTYCGVAQVGDYFVGTVDGEWMISARTKHWNTHTTSNKGLNFARVVEGSALVEIESKSCLLLQTKDIPSIKLFENFRIESKSRFPFSHYEFLKSSSPNTQSFTGDAPDPPAVACSDTSVFYGDDYKQTHQGQDDDYTILLGGLGLSNGCASVNMDFLALIGENFNFNYNPTTMSASSSLSLGEGVTCSNCYAYIGVYIYAVLEYWDYYAKMAFEAKLDGGLGFNVQVSIDNPKISGSTTFPLLPASSTTFSLPLGFGLSLSTNFGGFSATVSGSGSATGSATMGVGANANAYIGVEYEYMSSSYYGFEFPSNAEFSYIPPYLSYTSFEMDALTLAVELTATQDFSIGYYWIDVDWLGADFTVEFSGQAEYQYTGSAQVSDISVSAGVTGAAMQVSSNAAANAIELGQALTATSSVASARPGDIIPITVQVSGFNPGEETVLFFSFHRDGYKSTKGVSILQTKFVVPSSGSAAVTVNWQVPWDGRFLQSATATTLGPCSISVHASNHMSKVVHSPEFVVVADPQVDALVQGPAPDSIATAGSALEVTWDPKALTIFKKSVGSSGHGSLRTLAHAHVVLVKEELSAAGEVVSATSFDLTPDGVPNSGSATVVIPTSAYSAIIPVSGATSQRYFLFLHATKLSNMKGWSKGYFSVAAPPASQETVATVTPGSLRVATPSGEGLDEATSTLAATRRAKSLVKLPEMHTEVGHHSNVHFNKLSALFGTEYMKEHHGRKHLALADRELSSTCSGCTNAITFTATVDGTFASVIICDIAFPVGVSTGAIEVLTPICECVTGENNAPVPAPAPSASAPTAPSPPVADDRASYGSSYYFYFVAEDAAADDVVPNVVNGDSVAPTPAPIVLSITSTSSSSSSSTALSAGEIGGIAVGGAAFLALLALAVYLFKNSRRAADKAAMAPTQDLELELPKTTMGAQEIAASVDPTEAAGGATDAATDAVKAHPETDTVNPMALTAESVSAERI